MSNGAAPAPGQPVAALSPPSLGTFPGFTTGQVYYPELFIPENAGVQPRDYVQELLNGVAAVEIVRPIQVDIPGTVYAMCGSAVDSTGAALPVGLDPLDTFLFRLEHNSGDRFTTAPTLGSTVLGRNGLPRLVGARGWMWDRGGTIRIGLTPLRANLRINIALWIIEFRGPQNFTMR